jgi:hypothetical protein
MSYGAVHEFAQLLYCNLIAFPVYFIPLSFSGTLSGVHWLGVLPMSEIRVTCKTADSLPYEQIEPLQGRLRKRTDERIDKIYRSVVKH